MLALNGLLFGVLWLRRAPPPEPEPASTPVAAEEPDRTPESVDLAPGLAEAVAQLRAGEGLEEARATLSSAEVGAGAALLEGLKGGCAVELCERVEVLAAGGRMTGQNSEVLAEALVDAGLGAEPPCADAAASALASLFSLDALDGGAVGRAARRWLQGLEAGDPRALPLIALLDRVAPEGSDWPQTFEGMAGDPRYSDAARGAACRAIVHRRVRPEALIAGRDAAPGPVQRCLLHENAQGRIESARALLSAADVDVRLDALRALHGHGGPEDVPAMVTRLGQAPGRRERAALVETAGYLVQLNIEQADALVPRGAGEAEEAVRARAEAGGPAAVTFEDAWCDAVAEPGDLGPQVAAAARHGAGARLCLPAGTWSGDLDVAADVVLLAPEGARLQGALRLAVPAVVVGLVAESVSAPAGSVLLHAGRVDGALVVGEGAVAAVPLLRAVDVEQQREGWVAHSALTLLPVTSRFGGAPAHPPISWSLAPLEPLPLPVRAGDLPGAAAVGLVETAVLVPLRAADFADPADALLVGLR